MSRFSHVSLHARSTENLAQVRIFQNLIEDLPARAARKNFSKFACPRAPKGARSTQVALAEHTRTTLCSPRSQSSAGIALADEPPHNTRTRPADGSSLYRPARASTRRTQRTTHILARKRARATRRSGRLARRAGGRSDQARGGAQTCQNFVKICLRK